MHSQKMPKLSKDVEEEAFLDLDLSDLDFTQFKPATWERDPKTARVNMRLPEGLMEEVRRQAKARGIPYQRFIREAIERALQNGKT